MSLVFTTKSCNFIAVFKKFYSVIPKDIIKNINSNGKRPLWVDKLKDEDNYEKQKEIVKEAVISQVEEIFNFITIFRKYGKIEYILESKIDMLKRDFRLIYLIGTFVQDVFLFEGYQRKNLNTFFGIQILMNVIYNLYTENTNISKNQIISEGIEQSFYYKFEPLTQEECIKITKIISFVIFNFDKLSIEQSDEQLENLITEASIYSSF